MSAPRQADRAQARLEMPLLHVFRVTAERQDARKPNIERDEAGLPIVTSSRAAGRGIDERALREALKIDLTNLLNTTNLASTLDLSIYPAVRRSVLNYGVDDLVSLTIGSTAVSELTESLRQALMAYEPRLVPGTLTVTRHEIPEDVGQRIGFHISAELRCRPIDIAVEFVAEIDIGSGKLELRNAARIPPPPTVEGG